MSSSSPLFWTRTLFRRYASPSRARCAGVVLGGVLNDGEGAAGDEFEGGVRGVSARLNRGVLEVQGRCWAEDGSGVDYGVLAEAGSEAARAFETYVRAAASLRDVPDADLVWDGEDADALKALWLNLYNALTVHAICAVQAQCARDNAAPIASVLEVPDFWAKARYQVGSHVLSLDDIEHGILRGNRPHPSTKRACFGDGDPRRALSVPDAEVDPRLHFALVCGAKSCPPIRVFDASNVERALAKAAVAFLVREVSVDDAGVVSASPLLKWYGSDFSPDARARLLAVASYLPLDDARLPPPARALRERLDAVLADAPSASGVPLRFTAYDWRLNAV